MVALVITIIILLILVGVTINGILSEDGLYNLMREIDMHLNVEVHEEGFQSIKERRQSTRKRLAQNHTEKNSFSPPNTSRDPKHPLEESFYYSIKFTLRKY